MEKSIAERKGREEGREEGRRQEKIKIAKELLKKGMKLEEIIEITGLAKEEIGQEYHIV